MARFEKLTMVQLMSAPFRIRLGYAYALEELRMVSDQRDRAVGLLDARQRRIHALQHRYRGLPPRDGSRDEGVAYTDCQDDQCREVLALTEATIAGQ